MIRRHISEVIGNTPLLLVPEAVHELDNIDVYVKLEYLNPFGSLKDRTAWAMVEPHLRLLQDHQQTVVESSSGNTAKGLQALLSTFGVPLRTVTNRIKVHEQRDILTLLGADLHELPGTSACHDPHDPNDPLVVIEREVQRAAGQLHHTSQYTNMANVEAHRKTGAEILAELPQVDHFIGGLGTTGSTRGIAETLRSTGHPLRLTGVVAAADDYIPGIRTTDELWEVGLYEAERYDHIEAVTAHEAIEMTMRLVRQAGVLAGPTTGATLAAAVRTLRDIDQAGNRRQTAVFLACDRLEPYVSYLRERRPDLFAIPAPLTGFRAFSAAPLPAASEIDTKYEVQPGAAHQCLEDEGATVIDLRGALAFRTGHIAGAINITDTTFEHMLDGGSPFAADASVLLVCPIGRKSLRYARYLRTHGVNVHSLQGGMNAWRDAGLPLERSNRHA